MLLLPGFGDSSEIIWLYLSIIFEARSTARHLWTHQFGYATESLLCISSTTTDLEQRLSKAVVRRHGRRISNVSMCM